MTASARELLIEQTREEALADLAEVTADLRELEALAAGHDEWFSTPAVSAAHEARRAEGYERQRRAVEDLCARIGVRSPYAPATKET